MLATLLSWCAIKGTPRLETMAFQVCNALLLPVPLIDRLLRGERKDDDSVWRLEAALPTDPQTVLVPRRVRPGLLGA